MAVHHGRRRRAHAAQAEELLLAADRPDRAGRAWPPWLGDLASLAGRLGRGPSDGCRLRRRDPASILADHRPSLPGRAAEDDADRRRSSVRGEDRAVGGNGQRHHGGLERRLMAPATPSSPTACCGASTPARFPYASCPSCSRGRCAFQMECIAAWAAERSPGSTTRQTGSNPHRAQLLEQLRRFPRRRDERLFSVSAMRPSASRRSRCCGTGGLSMYCSRCKASRLLAVACVPARRE